MNISAISYAVSSQSFQGHQKVEVTRPQREYSPHQTLWNAYGDALLELGSCERELIALSEQIYKATDEQTKQKLMKEREAILDAKVEAEANYKKCQKELYEYRAKYGMDC